MVGIPNIHTHIYTHCKRTRKEKRGKKEEKKEEEKSLSRTDDSQTVSLLDGFDGGPFGKLQFRLL